MTVGVTSIIVGIVEVVVAAQTSLTFEQILAGGALVKDAYRQALGYSGFGVIILGALLVIIGSFLNADPGAVQTLYRLTSILATAVLIATAVIFAAYKNAERKAAAATSQSLTTESTATSASTTSTGSPAAAIACALTSNGTPPTSGGCTYSAGPQTNQVTSAPAVGSYDSTYGCTWTDQGQNAAGGYEVYTCQ